MRIGWQGGSSHGKDAVGLGNAIKRIGTDLDVEMVVMGSMLPEFETDNTEYHPWVDADTFYTKVGQLNLDIGLCPIDDNDFNRCKSNLKMLEYGVFNVPSVCSHIPDGPYNLPDGVEPLDRVLVGNTEEEWYQAIRELVIDKKKRKVIGDNAYDTVESVYNIERTWDLWRDCHEALHETLVVSPTEHSRGLTVSGGCG